MKILIRNIATEVTQKTLLSMFETYGKVLYCKLVEDEKTGEHKGFGFVEMPRPGDAKAAIKNLNSIVLRGQKIRVKRADNKADDKSIETSEETTEGNAMDTTQDVSADGANESDSPKPAFNPWAGLGGEDELDD